MRFMLLILFSYGVFFLFCVESNEQEQRKVHLKQILYKAVHFQQQGLLAEAFEMYQTILKEEPEHPDALHLSGLVLYHENQYERAKDFVEKAIRVAPDRSYFYGNLGEIYRMLKDFQKAQARLETCLQLDANSELGLMNMGVLFRDLNKKRKAIEYFTRLLGLNAGHLKAREEKAGLLVKLGYFDLAYHEYEQMIFHHPEIHNGYIGTGVALQSAGKFDQALEVYQGILRKDPDQMFALLNTGAIYQESGDFDKAILFYKKVLFLYPNESQAMNNLGSSLINYDQIDEGIKYLKKAINVTTEFAEPYVNLGTYFMEEGLLIEASEMFLRAHSISKDDGLLIREALMLPQVSSSHAEMISSRGNLEKKLDLLMKQSLQVVNPSQDVERPSFYLVYHGMNDLRIQKKIAALQIKACPQLQYVSSQLHPPISKIRVAFMSKFFVDNHAHGMLLEGIMKGLNRTLFQVIVIAHSDPRQQVQETIKENADEFYLLTLNFFQAREKIESLRLDVLIFADIMSEPMNYYLAFSRLATVQALFWGNPITSGIPSIDYFISGEFMEDANEKNEHYSEQVVLLKGQAIWYDKLTLPEQLGNRLDYGFEKEWIIYMCPQSVFKIQPSYDKVLNEILKRNSKSHLVLVEGRRSRWTERLQNRLKGVLEGLYTRVHFVPRVAGSIKFLQLISIADVILHPFPFGGSKTSTDGIALGIPVVSLVGTYLRSRMAYSFYAKMNVTECLAYSSQQYVEIAVLLGENSTYRSIVQQKIKKNSYLIWEDEEVVKEWELFLRNSLRIHMSLTK